MMSQTPNTKSAVLEARWQTIQAKIASHAEHLVTQGAIVARTTRNGKVWMLRFYVAESGRRIQKAIYIGSDQQTEILARARQLLARYRSRADWAREIVQSARWAALAAAKLRKICTSRKAKARRGCAGVAAI